MKIAARAILLTACAWAATGADSSTIQSVFVLDSELYVSTGNNSPPRQLTADGLGKAFPVWSPNGERIAFLRSNTRSALGDIVIVSSTGRELLASAFRARGDANVTGMRSVEELQWISAARLAVAGSVNPSTWEYAVIDAGTGKEIGWYSADGPSLTPSPDGKHVAYEAAVPHFVPVDQRRPRLCVDDECSPSRVASGGYPFDSQRHVEFATYPAWPASGGAVAVLAQDYKTNELTLIVRSAEGPPSEFALPGSSPGRGIFGYNSENQRLYHIVWAADTVFVMAGDSAWKLEPNGSALMMVPRESVPADDVTDALQLRRIQQERFKALGASQVDSWCASCALRFLPRRSGTREDSH